MGFHRGRKGLDAKKATGSTPAPQPRPILAMALEQLQIAPGIVVAAFSLLFGGIVLALAIAFGVGGIDAAKRIIEKGGEEKKEETGEKGRDIEHL